MAICHYCLVQRGAAAPDGGEAGGALRGRLLGDEALGPARARERHGVDAARGTPAARHGVERLAERLAAGQGGLEVRRGPGAPAAPAGPRRLARSWPARGRGRQRRRRERALAARPALAERGPRAVVGHREALTASAPVAHVVGRSRAAASGAAGPRRPAHGGACRHATPWQLRGRQGGVGAPANVSTAQSVRGRGPARQRPGGGARQGRAAGLRERRVGCRGQRRLHVVAALLDAGEFRGAHGFRRPLGYKASSFSWAETP
mmetsp:Transcript_110119/g.307924  ORF Transcript_110119/g.307924 Transcript_110119/m.307924 type:complete len:262 (-) Transcript_110119:7-792(-)